MFDFHLLYQPKVRDGKLVSAEALLRPLDEKITTLEFISNVVNTTHLDLLIIERCLMDIHMYDISLPISINIHPNSINDDDFVSNIIKNDGINKITLELIEYQSINITTHFKANIKKLQNNGFIISLDDFGKGFSRIDVALSLDVDEVKIDKSLIDNIENDYAKFKHLSFLHSKIRTLCTNRIIFEGVENIKQKETIELFANKPIIQGYVHYKPLHPGELAKIKSIDLTPGYKKMNLINNLMAGLERKLYRLIAKTNTISN